MLNYLLIFSFALVIAAYSAVRVKRSGKIKIDGYFEASGSLAENLSKIACAGGQLSLFETRLMERGFDPLAIYSEEKSGGGILAVYANKNFSAYASFFIFPQRAGSFSVELMTQRSDEKIILTSNSAPEMKLSGWIEHQLCGDFSAFGDLSLLASDEFFAAFDLALSAHVKKIISDHKPGYAPYYATVRNYAACRNYITGLKLIGGR